MGLAEKYFPHYTVKDYEKWEGDWELIEGVPYALASPSVKHQLIGSRLITQLTEELSQKCPECFAIYETDWYVNEDTVVRPDIMVVCGEVTDKVRKPPQLIIEIVSQSSARMDEEVKFYLYQREGVKFYILVYPEEKEFKIYKLTDNGYIRQEKAEIKINDCKINIDFSRIWI